MVSLSLKEIRLRPAQWKAVEKKARRAGATTPEYVRKLIERDLLSEKSFDEILRPIREDVARSGLNEDQLGALVRRARRGRKKAAEARR